jgi:putative heme-binding domain-containing protein
MRIRQYIITSFVLPSPVAARIRFLTALSVCCASAGLAEPKALQCAPGWKAEVIAEAPLISAPSVICASPDGRIFLGLDPVDMGSPSESTADKVVSIYPDGQVLTFATNLHAVFGLRYMDGKVYVHHTPKFSVFEDFHGMGINRVDLLTNENPHPWLTSFNDHIPSGFTLAMDGYFYFATGDKGLLGAVGVDGRKIEMRGGVYRMRPDGTGLEVYCTGTRNHLEVAINSEDEMFTFDNTDDGAGWWRRLTHMVDGGYYGYPYDYKTRRPYTLWCMADFGGGAPTGACAYDEDALPDEYKGNLFLCDWSGRVVYRMKVARDGSTFKESSLTNLVQSGVPPSYEFISKGTMDDFRPVGICVGSDGKSFYVTDWGHSYWKRDEKMGRVIKVTYTGKTQETPKPAWYVPAATGERFQATIPQLVRGLQHPAESVRLVAQRRLAERGQAAASEVLKLLKDSSAPPYARWFALWTLDAIDGGKKQRKAIVASLKDKDVTVAMQAARELGTRSVRQAAPALIAMLHTTNAAVRFRASTALGRLGEPAAIPALMKELDQKDLFARYAAFVALRRIGLADPKAWPEIVEGLAGTNAAIREGVGFALRETYDPALVKALAAFSARQNVPVATRTNVLSLLSSLSQKQPPWNGDWWNTQPANGAPAAKTVIWGGTPIVSSALRAAFRDREASIRQMGIDYVRSSHDTNAGGELAELFRRETDLQARIGILHDLAVIPTKQGQAVITSVLQDPNASVELLLAAIDSAGKMEGSQWNTNLIALAQTTKIDRIRATLFEFFGAKKLAATIPLLTTYLFNTNAGLRQHAMDALKAIGGQAAIDALVSSLNSSNAVFRRQVVSVLGDMKAKSALPALIKLAAASDTHEAVVGALAKMPDVTALDVYLDGLASKNAGLRTECETAMQTIQQQALPLIEARLTTNDLPALAMTSLKQIYQNDAAAKKSPFFHHKILETPPAQYQEFALAHFGDPQRGRTFFHDLKGAGCVRCHSINGVGGNIGPDLTGIKAKYPRAFIIESVIYPSKVILDGYQQILFQTKDGEEFSGMVRNENQDEVTMVNSAGLTNVLKKSNIKSRKVSQISLMPEGLESGLSLAEFSDLISYVENPALPEPPKPPKLATRIPGFPPSAHGPAQVVTAPEPEPKSEPEPAAELVAFLDVAAQPETPDHPALSVHDLPALIRPTPSPAPSPTFSKPDSAVSAPPAPSAAPAPSTDDDTTSNAPAHQPPHLPPPPPGMAMPPPPPTPQE